MLLFLSYNKNKARLLLPLLFLEETVIGLLEKIQRQKWQVRIFRSLKYSLSMFVSVHYEP